MNVVRVLLSEGIRKVLVGAVSTIDQQAVALVCASVEFHQRRDSGYREQIGDLTGDLTGEWLFEMNGLRSPWPSRCRIYIQAGD